MHHDIIPVLLHHPADITMQMGVTPLPALSKKHVDVQLIATDVDGTLLNSQQQLSPGVEAAVKQAAAAGVPVRSRWGQVAAGLARVSSG